MNIGTMLLKPLINWRVQASLEARFVVPNLIHGSIKLIITIINQVPIISRDSLL